MDTISSEPKLTGSQKSDFVRRTIPSTQSSMYVNDRVWRPSPHISTSVVAVAALRQNAAGRFLAAPLPGPERAVDVVEPTRCAGLDAESRLW